MIEVDECVANFHAQTTSKVKYNVGLKKNIV